MARLSRAAKLVAKKSTTVSPSNIKRAALKRPGLKKSATRSGLGRSSDAPKKKSITKKSVTKRPAKRSSGPSWLAKGEESVESRKKQAGGKSFFNDVPTFFLGEGEKARIRFVESFEEVTQCVDRHTYKKISQSGKPYYITFTCVGRDNGCQGCANGDKPSARWPVLLVDMRRTDVYSGGKKESRAGAVKLFTPSIKEHENLRLALEEENERRARKGEDPVDLQDVVFTITRTGQKAQTGYRFSVYDEMELPQKYVDRYDAFIEEHGGLEKILEPLSEEDQLQIIEGSVGDDNRPNKPSRKSAPKKRKDEDDDEYEDDDDDEYVEY